MVENPTDPLAWAGLAGDVVDLIPGVTGVGETIKTVNATKKVINAGDAIVDGVKTVDKASTVAKGWHVGDNITNLTKAGKEPSWPTVRRRYWKNEALYHGDLYGADDIGRMQSGKPPLVRCPDNGKLYPMELHHKNPRHNGGLHTYDNLEPLSPWEHAIKDQYRYFSPN